MTVLLGLVGVLTLTAAPASEPATWIPPGPPPSFEVQLMNGGRLAASGHTSVLLHDLENGKDLQLWTLADAGACFGPVLATDGVRIAAGCGDQIAVLAPGQAVPVARWRTDGGVTQLVFSADGRELSALTNRQMWRVFNAATGAERWSTAPTGRDSSLVQSGAVSTLPDGGRQLALRDGGAVSLRFRDLVAREADFILSDLPDGGTRVLRASDKKPLWSWAGTTWGGRQKFGRDGVLAVLDELATVYDANTGAVRSTADCGLVSFDGVSPDGRWAIDLGMRMETDRVCRLDVPAPKRTRLPTAGTHQHLLTEDGRGLLSLLPNGLAGLSTADGKALRLGLEDAGAPWNAEYLGSGSSMFVRFELDGAPVVIDTRPPGRATRLRALGEGVNPRALCPEPDGGTRLLTSSDGEKLEELLDDRLPYAISPDCKSLARVVADQGVELRVLPSGQLSWKHAVDNVKGLGFSDDGKRLAVVLSGAGGWVQLLDLADPRRIEVLSAPDLAELQVGERGVFAFSNRLVRYGGKPLAPEALLTAAPVVGLKLSSSVAVLQSEQSLALSVIPLSEPGIPLLPGAPLGPIAGIVHDGERVVAWGPEGASARDEKTGAARPLPLRDPSGPATATAWAAGVRAVLGRDCLRVDKTAARPANLDSVWTQGECLTAPAPFSAQTVSISQDGLWALTVGYQGQLTLWDLARRSVVRTFGPATSSSQVALRADGKVAYRLDDDGELTAWSTPSPRKLWTRKTEGKFERVVAAPKGGLLAVTRGASQIEVLDGEKRVRTIDLSTALDEVATLAFTNDGTRLLVGTRRGALLQYVIR